MISRTECDAQKAHIPERQSKNEWLMEQLRLLKKNPVWLIQRTGHGVAQLGLLFNETEA